MKESKVLCAIVVLLLYFERHVRSDDSNHRYKAGDHVPLYANMVGPYRNPSEKYEYYSLPFCNSDIVKHKEETLGEVLNGDRMVTAPYRINFLEEKDHEVACQKNLSREEVSRFRTAVSEDYYFEMYYDDLPVWGFLGMNGTSYNQNKHKCSLFKHFIFKIFYNKDRVIQIQLSMNTKDVADITEDQESNIEFSYTVTWSKTDIPFHKRMDIYRTSQFFPVQEIHARNSSILVLLLAGSLVMFYVKVLKKDFVESSNDEESANNREQRGWKNLYGDVFRYPNHKSLLAAALGSGTQLLILAVIVSVLGVSGVFYPHKQGNLLIALLIIYAFTSGVAGYAAASFYFQLEGVDWGKNLLLTGCLFSLPLAFTFSFLNYGAMTYKVNVALPFGTIMVIVLIWTLVALPLLLLGGIAGVKIKPEFQAPCRTSECARDIPALRWYRGILPQMALAGIVPFSFIYTELYYIFVSLWGLRIYNSYGVLFVNFIILLIVTALVSVALTYFQLAHEDHRWWWRSFLYGGSTGLYIWGYCLYYYYSKTDWSGFLQTSFFFGYMACICYGIFLMLGAVGFSASLLFVRHIYGSIKCD